MKITEFLEARIAEDEAMAQAVVATVAPDAWENPTKWGNFFPQDVVFWDTQTPYRVLAECKAKRAILEEHGPVEDRNWMGGEAHDHLWCGSCGSIDDSPVPFPCETLKAIAAVYADHRDYRQEWA